MKIRRIISFFSLRPYFVVVVPLWPALACVALRDGFHAPHTTLLILSVGAAIILNRQLMLEPAGAIAPNTADQLLCCGRPTILEFQTDSCAEYTKAPALDSIERDAGGRLQILRIDAREGSGRQLAECHDVSFTPSSILCDRKGQFQREMVWGLERACLLYWMDHP